MSAICSLQNSQGNDVRETASASADWGVGLEDSKAISLIRSLVRFDLRSNVDTFEHRIVIGVALADRSGQLENESTSCEKQAEKRTGGEVMGRS